MGSDDTSTYPGSGALLAGGKNTYVLLVLYYEHTVATMVLLELCFQRKKKTGIDPPTLRVQAPLYWQGLVTCFHPTDRLPAPQWS
jgi:hypothetical protein